MILLQIELQLPFANLSLMNGGLELRAKCRCVYTFASWPKLFFSVHKDGVFFCYKKNSYNILMCMFARIVEKRHTSTVNFFSMYSLSNHTSYGWLDSIVFSFFSIHNVVEHIRLIIFLNYFPSKF